MKTYIYMKAGGSFITHKNRPLTLNPSALKALREILEKAVSGSIRLIMGNGGGSFAHYIVSKYRNSTARELLVKCHEATRTLNRILVDYLVSHGLPVTSMQTSAIIHYNEESGNFEVFYRPVETLVDMGVIPVVYGECIQTRREPIIVSTEMVFKLLSQYLKPQRIILLTDVSGVYTCNPQVCSNPELIERITPENLDNVLSLLRDQEKSDATGGIYGKVLSMSKLAMELKTEVVILSGFNVEAVTTALSGGIPREATIITYK